MYEFLLVPTSLAHFIYSLRFAPRLAGAPLEIMLYLSVSILLHLSSGLFDGIHQCGIFRDQCMRLCSFLGSDYRDCHVNLPHIIRWSCPRLRSSCGCHLFLYENGDKTRKNAENSRVRNQGVFLDFSFKFRFLQANWYGCVQWWF